jgi:hypothetical protein
MFSISLSKMRWVGSVHGGRGSGLLLVGSGILLLLLSACATPKSRSQNQKNSLSGVTASLPARGPRASDSAESMPRVVVRGVELENTDFDFPLTLNSRVLHWVDYFTGRGRKHFERYLERSEFFIPFIIPLLRENKMPEDLVYLAMIESGFNNLARSHAKAVGPWQFISATGKRYGLMVNWWVDERRDTHKSTLAAIAYLKDLYQMFDSWELAASAYNAGEAKIARAIRRYGTQDYWALTRHRYLRQETRDYVPKIIAAAIVAKNRTQFGFLPSGIRADQDEVVTTDGEVVVVEKVKEPSKGLAEEVAAEGEGTESIETVLKREGWVSPDEAIRGQTVTIEGAVVGEKARAIAMPSVNKQGELSGEPVVEFEVQSPADLLQVARAAELSYGTVKALNPELLRWCTPPTVPTFRIRLPVSVKDKFLDVYNHPEFPRKVEFLTHRTRGSDTLQRVARHLGLRVDPLVDLNRVGGSALLRRGTTVLLPMPNDPSRTVASLEIRDPPDRKRRKSWGKRRAKISERDRASARRRVRN